MVKPDEEVISLHTLKLRLNDVRQAQQRGTLRKPTTWSPGILVPDEWFRDALETRALKLEHLIVIRSVAQARCVMCQAEVEGTEGLLGRLNLVYVVVLRAKSVLLTRGDVLCDWCRGHVRWYKHVPGVPNECTR